MAGGAGNQVLVQFRFWKFVRTRPLVDEVVARCTTVSSVAWLALAPPPSGCRRGGDWRGSGPVSVDGLEVRQDEGGLQMMQESGTLGPMDEGGPSPG